MRFIKMIPIFVLMLFIFTFNTNKVYMLASSQHPITVSSQDITTEQNVVKKSVKAENWLLNGEEGVEDPAQFLTNLDDPTGGSYIRIEDLVDAMQTKEEKIKNRGSHVTVRKMTSDGRRMAIIRDFSTLDQVGKFKVEIYELQAEQKEFEFQMPANTYYPAVSPDLRKYVYTLGGKVFLYNATSKQTTKINWGTNKVSTKYINDGMFSPDGSQFCFEEEGKKGLVLLDLSKVGGIQRILTGSQASLLQWDRKDELMYTIPRRDGTYINDVYSYNVRNHKNLWVTKSEDPFIFSADHKELLRENYDSPEVYIVHISNGRKKDVTSIFKKQGSLTVPIQWLHTTTNYMKFSSDKVKL
ncbi:MULTISPECIES: hypothetical protein [Paenibacillus]|uniref:hypothetical protein n=1 Tax=Paenibacillus TaxID=44249 RepID=UPI0020B7FE3A|nr:MULTISPECIES: hypothetical protein [Paenibacillus]MCP3746760.1 hypothetical protein [Paenibacillus sp. A3M_27_13]